MRTFWVYILASRSKVLYVGVTNDLARRVFEHRHMHGSRFTSRYGVTRLVYANQTSSVRSAISREKEIKGWRRARKIALIESLNPDWCELMPDTVNDPSLRSG